MSESDTYLDSARLLACVLEASGPVEVTSSSLEDAMTNKEMPSKQVVISELESGDYLVEIRNA